MLLSGTNNVVEFLMISDQSKRRRGVYLLPNLLTSAALFAGFYSIISGINDKFEASAIAIIIAGLLDGLDGRVARMTHTQSDFGEQYDSLSDLISFGLAPALLAFNWSLSSLGEISTFAGKLGWLAAFLYMACTALRLARFNTQVGVADKRYFQGLASPAAAGTLVFTIWFFIDNNVNGETVRWLIFFEIITLGILMFSNIRYYSFKIAPNGEKVPAMWLLLAMLIIVLLALNPPVMGMTFGFLYVASGLLVTIAGRRNWKLKRHQRMAGETSVDARADEATAADASGAEDRRDPGGPHA